jgi:KAP family P-loop domain
MTTRQSKGAILDYIPNLLKSLRSGSKGDESISHLFLVDDLLTRLTQKFFSSLANLLTDNPDDVAHLEEVSRILADFRGALDQNITISLKQEPAQSAEEALLAQLRLSVKKPYEASVNVFTEEVVRVFFQMRIEGKSAPAQRTRHAVHPIPLSPETKPLISSLATALQETVLSTPATYYNNINDTVPDAIKKELGHILTTIDTLRLVYNLPIHDIGNVTIRLHLEIARAGGYAWFPIRSLVTAPLSSDDLYLYARGNEEAKKFAHQIIRNEGVFLITGYRGVGKSTFVNQSLSLCDKVAKNQREMPPWRIIPVTVSLAKASSTAYILRLCIRKLYETLVLNDAYKLLLTKDEKNHLAFAYGRSVYKVNVQEDVSTEILKHLETQLSWSIKLGSLLPSPVNPLLPTLLPNFDANAKVSRDDARKFGSTAALLDYDEDKAEDDLVTLINTLATSTLPATRKERIKLVFVFDEIDKMTDKDQENLIGQLKNLFLARYAVFLLVTSKEFYYTWLEERKKEDTVLASYFSGVKMIPLFTSEETTALLKQLVGIEPEKYETPFLEDFARYLTYRSRGIPRDIVRELQALEEWTEEDPQAFITSRSKKYNSVLLYAQLQVTLNNILKTMFASDTANAASLLLDEEPVLPTEHLSANDARREQIRIGMYILLEELLDLGTLVLDPDSDNMQAIYNNNFKQTVAKRDFNRLLQELNDQLPSMHLTIPPGSDLTRIYSDDAVLKLFTSKTENEKIVLQVSHHFYTITGRSISTQSQEATIVKETYSLHQLSEWLKRKEFILQRRSVSELLNQATTLPDDINQTLCQIFINPGDETLRRDAASLLKGPQACASIFSINQDDVRDFIKRESNERLLLELIRLIAGATTIEIEKRHDGALLLLQLAAIYDPTVSYRRPASKELQTNLLTTLMGIADEDVLESVINILNPGSDIDSNILQPLIHMARKFHRNLVEILFKHNFTNISAETLQAILRSQLEEQHEEAWNALISEKQSPLAQRMLVILLQQRPILGTKAVELWLNSPTWSIIDEQIVKQATQANPTAFSKLESLLEEDKRDRISETLSSNATSTLNPPIAALPPTSPSTVWTIAGILAMLLSIAIYFVVPFDLPQQFGIWQHFFSRLFELLYVYLGLFSGISAGIFLADRSKDWMWAAIISFPLGVGCFIAQLLWFRPNFTLLGQVYLIALLIATITIGGILLAATDA